MKITIIAKTIVNTSTAQEFLVIWIIAHTIAIAASNNPRKGNQHSSRLVMLIIKPASPQPRDVCLTIINRNQLIAYNSLVLK
jgi:hypothetical protein